MILNFEIDKDFPNGKYPDIIQFQDSEAQIFDIEDGLLYGRPSPRIKYGEWDEKFTVGDKIDISPDINMDKFSINTLSGFGIVGGYRRNNDGDYSHKLLIHEFAQKIDKYLDNGSITQRLDNPIDSFRLVLKNPDIKNPEKPGNIIINENTALAIPGSKIKFKFGLGTSNEPEYDIGEFYIDSSSFSVLAETASVDGRNLIGKSLREQTVDENNVFEPMFIHETIEQILYNANLSNDQYIIQPSSYLSGWEVKPDSTFMSTIESILSVGEPLWIMRELSDGTIVIGDPNYVWFDKAGTYRFERSKDIFSREITYDDIYSYRKVCVHNNDFTISEYSKVSGFSGWNLQANRTLFVDMPEGVSNQEAKSYANELATQLSRAGKIESFTGPFKPYLQVGDMVVIYGDDIANDLGLITDITHNFGNSGFTTNFTVDSGGKAGKGRIGDYIKTIANSKGNSSSSIKSIK